MAAVISVHDPLWINGVEFNAEEVRRNQGYQFAGGATPGTSRTGLLNPRDLSLSLSGRNVMVGPGGAVIGTAKGAYICGVATATPIVELLAADVTNPRRDRVVLEILDPDNGGGAGRKAQLRIIDGSPNALAATGGGFPAMPQGAIFIDLGYVDVPKSGAGSPTVTITAPLTATAGAPIPVRSLADRNALATWPGLQVIRLDIPSTPVETYTGTKWTVSDTQWTTLSLVQGFEHYTSVGWSGLKGRVKNGHYYINGAIWRPTAWSPETTFMVVPAGMKPEHKTAGINCEVETSVGNVVMTAAGGTGASRSVNVSWPLPS